MKWETSDVYPYVQYIPYNVHNVLLCFVLVLLCNSLSNIYMIYLYFAHIIQGVFWYWGSDIMKLIYFSLRKCRKC